MPKESESPILPHLKSEELSDRDHEESKLGRQLSACRKGDDFDTERSYHVMQDSAEQIFDVMYAAFRKRSGYKEEWVPEMVRLAVFRTISTSLGYIQYGIRNLSLDALGETLEETVWNHLEELKNTSSQAQLDSSVSPANPAFPGSIGEQIRQLREECLFTNEQLAEALGVDRRSVVRHISGDNLPSKQHISKYQKLFSTRLRKEVRLKTSL